MQETNKTYNLGYLNGWLSSIASVNDKTNHQFDFKLTKHENAEGSLQEKLNLIFK